MISVFTADRERKCAIFSQAFKHFSCLGNQIKLTAHQETPSNDRQTTETHERAFETGYRPAKWKIA